jgi:hypothetical protein
MKMLSKMLIKPFVGLHLYYSVILRIYYPLADPDLRHVARLWSLVPTGI